MFKKSPMLNVTDDCCMVWSVAVCHWRDNGPVSWTAACLCENCWATLRTYAL